MQIKMQQSQHSNMQLPPTSGIQKPNAALT